MCTTRFRDLLQMMQKAVLPRRSLKRSSIWLLQKMTYGDMTAIHPSFLLKEIPNIYHHMKTYECKHKMSSVLNIKHFSNRNPTLTRRSTVHKVTTITITEGRYRYCSEVRVNPKIRSVSLKLRNTM